MKFRLSDYQGNDLIIDDNDIKTFTPYPDGCFLETTKGNHRVMNRMLDPNRIDIDKFTHIVYPSFETLRKTNGKGN